MSFLQNIVALLSAGAITLSVSLFLLSTILLLCAVASKAYADTVDLGFLGHRRLNWIEQTHPHLPSAKSVLLFNICVFMLLAIALELIRGAFPFNDPYQGMNVATLFLLAASIGTLSELYWKQAKEYAFAFIIGTAIAFFAATSLSFGALLPLSEQLILGASALGVSVLGWFAIGSATRTNTTWIMATVTFACWIFIFLLQ